MSDYDDEPSEEAVSVAGRVEVDHDMEEEDDNVMNGNVDDDEGEGDNDDDNEDDDMEDEEGVEDIKNSRIGGEQTDPAGNMNENDINLEDAEEEEEEEDDVDEVDENQDDDGQDDIMSTKSGSNEADEEDGSAHSEVDTKSKSSIAIDTLSSSSPVSAVPDDSKNGTTTTSTRTKPSKATRGGRDASGTKKAATAGQVGVKRPRTKPHIVTNRKGRTPSIAGLTIPFRTVKKAMKLDPDIPIVQNEAAILTTLAAELYVYKVLGICSHFFESLYRLMLFHLFIDRFLKTLARQSHANAKHRGRNTIRYEDVAEARTQEPSYAFLEPLLP